MDAELLRKKDDRVVYEYELPAELADKDEYVKKSIGLVKLKMSEEVRASSGVGDNKTKLAYAFLRYQLWEVDGRRINRGEGEEETIIENCDPAIRALMLEAMADLGTMDETVSKKFLASRKAKV